MAAAAIILCCIFRVVFASVSFLSADIGGDVEGEQRRESTPSNGGRHTAAVQLRGPSTWPTSISAGHVQLDAVMADSIRFEGETLRLRCEITGQPLPRYMWFKDGQAIVSPPQPTGGDVEQARRPPGGAVATVQSLTATTDRFSAKTTAWGSRLKIDNLKLEDSGVYRCEGFNEFGRQWTNGSLLVKPGSNPSKDRKQPPISTTYEVEESDVIDREDLDFGVPLFHGLPHQGRRNQQRAPSGGSRPEFSESDITFDLIRRGGDQDHADEVIEPYHHASGNTRGQCQRYEGAACSKFVGNRNIFVRSTSNQPLLEIQVTEALTELEAFSRMMSPQCMQYALPVLCYSAFPPCISPSNVDSPAASAAASVTDSRQTSVGHGVRRICRNVCDRMERNVCSEEYSFIQRTTMPIANLVSLLPDCSRLSNDPLDCIQLTTETDSDPSSINNYQDCFNETGVEYRGQVAITRSGKPCQRWNSLSVIGALKSERFDLSEIRQHVGHLGDHNFCRNPESFLTEPWCYTGSDKLVRETCAVRKCNAGIQTLTFGFDDYILRYAVIGCTSFIVVIIVTVAAGLCLCRHRGCVPCSSSNGIIRDSAVPTVVVAGGACKANGELRGGGESSGETHQQLLHQGFNVDAVYNGSSRPTSIIPARSSASSSNITSGSPASPSRVTEFPASCVHLLNRLGADVIVSVVDLPFGPTFIGQLDVTLRDNSTRAAVVTVVGNGRQATPPTTHHCVVPSGSFRYSRAQPVLVQILESTIVDRRKRADFWNEVDRAAALIHPNLMMLIGVTGRRRVKGQPPPLTSAIFQLDNLSTEDLRQFLVRRTSCGQITQLDNRYDQRQADGAPVWFTPNTALDVASQIAAGVCYLHDRGIVHGDLAARNCLVTASESALVGLSSQTRTSIIAIKICIGPAIIGRVTYPTDYVQIDSSSTFPIRWMSPEALARRSVGTGNDGDGRRPQTSDDVWSFGVTLWEVCTTGARPYGNESDQLIVNKVSSGRLRLPFPSSSASSTSGLNFQPLPSIITLRMLYSLMTDCWQSNPETRPSLRQISEHLERFGHEHGIVGDALTSAKPVLSTADVQSSRSYMAAPTSVDDGSNCRGVDDGQWFGEFVGKDAGQQPEVWF